LKIRLDHPYGYYNQKLAQKSLKAFMLSLRQKWVRQKYEIMLETFSQKTNEDMKSKVFLKLCENIYQIKKKRYIDTVIKDFRKDTLLTKAFSGLKQCVRSRLMPQQIINYCTENMHTFETRDAFLEREQQLSMKQKVELDTSTCMFNEERIVASPQVPVNQEVQVSKLD
jgi:hypothetical protein